MWGTYPERGNGIGGGAGDLPLSTIAFVDYGTTTLLANQNGFIGTPFATVQQALDAGFTSVYINGFGNEDVVAPGFVILTGMDGNVSLNSLTLPDNSGAQLFKCAIGTITAGISCNVITDRGFSTGVFGAGGFLVVNGPGALSFGAKIDQCALGDITMLGGTLLTTFAVFPTGTTVDAQTIEMFGCTSVADMNAVEINIQESALTAGTYTTTGEVDLQNVRCGGGVAFHNALGQPFNLDGFSNYWIKHNGVTLSHVGQKVITDDLTP